MAMPALKPGFPEVTLVATSTGGIAFVTVGDPGSLTGHHLYSRRMLKALGQIGLPVIQLPLPEGPYPRAVVALRSALSRHNPSLVIVDSTALATVVPLMSWIRRQLRARMVALMHVLPSDLAPSWQRPAVRYMESRLLQSADRIVAVSPFLRGQIIAAGAAAERTALVVPGRDGIPIAHRPRSGSRGHSFRFLCVAHWTPNKGIHLAIEAMAELDGRVHLDLVGSGKDKAYVRRVYALVRRHDLAERVHVHGPLRDDALAGRYAVADALVLPSRSEGFGTVCAEAMNLGLPVIACRVGPLPWLVEEGCGMLVPPGDVTALAEAMRALVAHPSLLHRMGEAARQRALRLPTWQQSEERFCNLVGALLLW